MGRKKNDWGPWQWIVFLDQVHLLYSLDGLPWNINTTYNSYSLIRQKNLSCDEFKPNVLQKPNKEIVFP